MTSRWAGLVVCLFLAGAGLSLYSAGCDPCHTCPTTTVHHRRTPTPTATATPAPNACLPSSSLGVLVQTTNATVYAPQGRWGTGAAAVKVVPIETSSGIGTGAAPTTVVTGSVPNSCSSNSATGTTVCTGNTTDVFLINGTTLSSTVTSGARTAARLAVQSR